MLNTNRLIRYSINLAPTAAQVANINSLLVLGSSDVLDINERIREYNDLASVASDFGTSAPEYLAASLYFGQVPQPTLLFIGRWAESATNGLLKGAILTAAEQAMSNWTSITTGTLTVSVDGTPQNLTTLNFSAQTNLNGVASVIDTALTGASVTWDGQRFRIISSTTGATSTVGFATGTIAAQMKLDASHALAIGGISAETPEAAAAIFADRFGQRWYALMVADTSLTPANHLAVAAFIEGTGQHIYAVTDTNTLALDSADTTTIGYLASQNNYLRTYCQYSENPYAVASAIGREMVVNFNGNNTTITLMYKQEPGVTPQDLTGTQATTLKNKRINVFAAYNNDTNIIQYGTMSGPAYLDEIHGLDALGLDVQADLWNALYTAKNKIPQTDAGVHELVAVAENTCRKYVRNGFIAPGTWNSNTIGELQAGDYMDRGYYVFVEPISNQAQSTREARISPPINIALKLAGAIHEVDVLISVNR